MRKSRLAILGIFFLAGVSAGTARCEPGKGRFGFRDGRLQFEWDYREDRAVLTTLDGRSICWEGGLLPAYWLRVHRRDQYVKTVVIADSLSADGHELVLSLRIGSLGRGRMVILREGWGIRFSELRVHWSGEIPEIIEMYFGVSDKGLAAAPAVAGTAGSVDGRGGRVAPTWDRPFMPDWQATGFCVPGAKGGTVQSFFRSWDFGQANIALGSFGPSVGSPYGAAYPRPVLYAGMGSDSGCLAIGAGSIPDAAMSLRVESTKGCFQYVYNEDRWGAGVGRVRVWKEPLRISLGMNAWMAFHKYYGSFPVVGVPGRCKPCPAIWNTWGMWGQGKYAIAPIADFAKDAGATVLVLDGGWEAEQGEGRPNAKRFPHFADDVRYIRDKGLGIGVWESIGWIADPFSHGLAARDLICDKDGLPCKANWNFDPLGESYYCMDPSSAAVRDFIRKRTIGMMLALRPAVIKLDFGYGLPDPSMGVPKDPVYRGERYAYALVKLIGDVARSIDPDVRIMYYGISPLWASVTDIISLDDQNDLWYGTKQGHDEWSIWASLVGDRGVAISGSSGYDWGADAEAVLNTCILGSPGAVLAVSGKNDSPVDVRYVNKRLAIDTWYRKTISWWPLWLNSDPGNFSGPPTLRNWGRMEVEGGDSVVTALVLRNRRKDGLRDDGLRDDGLREIAPKDATIWDSLTNKFSWTGDWALIAQDSLSVFSSLQLAVVPFNAGSILLRYATRPLSVMVLNREGEKEFLGWDWRNGVLKIEVDEESVRKTAGFLINR